MLAEVVVWLPRISALEVVLLFTVAVPVSLLAVRYSKWLLGIVACFAIAVLATPADPGSTIVAAGLGSLLYVIGVLGSRWMMRD